MELGNALIGLIGVVVGTVLGGFISWLTSYLQQNREDKRERHRIHREKLEGLYEVVAQFKKALRHNGHAAHYTISESSISAAGSVLPIERLLKQWSVLQSQQVIRIGH